MFRYSINVVLQKIHIRKDGIVDSLQDIVRTVRTRGRNFQCIVDKSIAKGLHAIHSSLYEKMT